ncbi:MAG: hypothetical protein AB7V02_05630, partial [Parvularculaceae bacterium]
MFPVCLDAAPPAPRGLAPSSDEDLSGAFPVAVSAAPDRIKRRLTMQTHHPHRFCVAPLMDGTDRHCRYFHR